MTARDCFNKAATSYDFHCHLQLATGEKLISLVDAADNVIDLGCGTGITTCKLKYKKLYCLDISEKLLLKAKERLVNKNVTFLEMSFDDFTGLELDLAFANMSLQWSDNFKLTLNNIRDNLKPNGILAFSIPLAGTFAGLSTEILSFFSIEEVKQFLGDWQIIYTDYEEINYVFPSLIDSLRSIKAVGANYCKTKIKKVIPRDKSPHVLKYHIGYFVVQKL